MRLLLLPILLLALSGCRAPKGATAPYPPGYVPKAVVVPPFPSEPQMNLLVFTWEAPAESVAPGNLLVLQGSADLLNWKTVTAVPASQLKVEWRTVDRYQFFRHAILPAEIKLGIE